jgi:hypothetical protein
LDVPNDFHTALILITQAATVSGADMTELCLFDSGTSKSKIGHRACACSQSISGLAIFVSHLRPIAVAAYMHHEA